MPEVKARTISALFVAILMIIFSIFLKNQVEKWEPESLTDKNIKYYSILVIDTSKSVATAVVLPWIMLYVVTLQELAEKYVDLWIDFFNAILTIGDIVPDNITAFGGKRRH